MVVRIIIILFLFTGTIFAQSKALVMPEDQRIFEKYIKYIEPWKSGNKDTLLEKTALFFKGRPYTAHTLEGYDVETLVVNLREFDCFTFVESVMALALTAASVQPDIETFTKNLESIRYRNGSINDYSSRLHYTSDWIFDNGEADYLKNISVEIGGILEDKTINFMSEHRKSYKQLKKDDEMLKRIKVIENKINSRGGFAYLPKDNIAIAAPLIPHMAIIGFTTSIEGLDVTHTGFAFHNDGELTFIHASSLEDEIVIDKKSVSDYCKSQKSCTGIIVSEIL